MDANTLAHSVEQHMDQVHGVDVAVTLLTARPHWADWPGEDFPEVDFARQLVTHGLHRTDSHELPNVVLDRAGATPESVAVAMGLCPCTG